jgi:hypothetical protein
MKEVKHHNAFCTGCGKMTDQLDNTAYLLCCTCNTQNSLLNIDGTVHAHLHQGPSPIVVQGVVPEGEANETSAVVGAVLFYIQQMREYANYCVAQAMRRQNYDGPEKWLVTYGYHQQMVTSLKAIAPSLDRLQQPVAPSTWEQDVKRERELEVELKEVRAQISDFTPIPQYAKLVKREDELLGELSDLKHKRHQAK